MESLGESQAAGSVVDRDLDLCFSTGIEVYYKSGTEKTGMGRKIPKRVEALVKHECV